MKGERPQYIQGERWEATLGQIVPDSKLLDKYPVLKNLKVGYIFDNKSSGAYFYKTGRVLIKAPDEPSFLKKLQHEVDHAVKEIENGPEGADVEYRGVEGTPDHKRAIKKYKNFPGEIEARKAEETPFGEYFQLYSFQKKEPQENSGLIKRLMGKLFFSSAILLALVFFSQSITGNTILSRTTEKTFSQIVVMGIILLIILYICSKRKTLSNLPP